VKRVTKSGHVSNVGSEMKWASWQVPPVICRGCGQRVRLKDEFFASRLLGTFHVGCAPYERRAAA